MYENYEEILREFDGNAIRTDIFLSNTALKFSVRTV